MFILYLSLIIWFFLLFVWGNFWWLNRQINAPLQPLEFYPHVSIIIPARNESETLPLSLPSVLNQDYSGKWSIILVDDNSSDRTTQIAQNIAKINHQINKINIIQGKNLPPNWKGKLWAIKQGIDFSQEQTLIPDYFLLTDADIKHDLSNLSQLVEKAEQENLALVSLMVLLRCETFWEKLLVPAFVFFFQKLYPFPWVNDVSKPIAAAAGGCILIRRQALEDIGGIEAISQALIDDCSLAQAVKFNRKNKKNHNIWLGLTKTTLSIRAYDNLKTIWTMIARTAFTQLNYSVLLLIGTVIGMGIIYLAPPVYLVIGLVNNNWSMTGIGAIAWLLMTVAYFPTIKFYKLSFLWAVNLPAIALLYTFMTIDSAIKYWQGKGGAWKGRTYNSVK
ncbi:MAG: glycosyltransferase [Pleurocapsa sp.]